MFSGKTRGAEKLIADSVLQEGRVLIVSNRVTLVHDHISNFNKVVKAAWMNAHGTECPDRMLFVQYNKAVKGTNLAEVPRLVCQAESLGRLQGTEPYSQVLMDESESILAQLSSQMTMEDRAGIVTQVLYDVLMKGQKVVFADAYITRRTLNLVHHIFDARNDKVKVIYNSWCQERVAYLLDKEEFTKQLIKRLTAGKNCAVFCGTKAFADYVYKHVKQALPDLPVLYYSRDTPGKKKEEDLADVNSSWVQCNLLLYTSTLLVGVSKNITCVQAFSVWTVCTACVHVMFTSKLNCIPSA